MPYKSKEKQREVQRHWAAAKAKRTRAVEGAKLDLIDIQPFAHLIQLKKGTVTWAELNQSDYFEKIDKWEDCVTLGKTYINHRRTNRLVVAALAVRACVIKHGGRKTKLVHSEPSLTAYAKEIGINFRTLWTWIEVKRRVVDHLPQGTEQIDFTAGMIAVRFAAKSGKDPVAFYTELAAKPALLLLQRVQNLVFMVLTKNSVAGLSRDQKDDCIKKLKDCINALK